MTNIWIEENIEAGHSKSAGIQNLGLASCLYSYTQKASQIN